MKSCRIGDLEQIAQEQPLGTRLDAEQGIATAQDALDAANHVVASGRRAAGKQHGNAFALRHMGIRPGRRENDIAGSMHRVRKALGDAVAVLGVQDARTVGEGDGLRLCRRTKRGANREG